MVSILALDGATRVSGIAVLDQQDRALIALKHVVQLKLKETETISNRLYEFRCRFLGYLQIFKPDYVVIEDLKFNKFAPNFSSLVKVAMLLGVASETVVAFGKQPLFYTASTVRAAIQNKAKKNKKSETRRIVNYRFKNDLLLLDQYPLTSSQEDISDAVALGWVAMSKLNPDEMVKYGVVACNICHSTNIKEVTPEISSYKCLECGNIFFNNVANTETDRGSVNL